MRRFNVSVDLTSVEDGVLVQIATSVDLVGEMRALGWVRPPRRVQCGVYFERCSRLGVLGGQETDDLFVIGERDDQHRHTPSCAVPWYLLDPLPLCSPTAWCLTSCRNRAADHEHFVVDPRLASLASLLDEHATRAILMARSAPSVRRAPAPTRSWGVGARDNPCCSSLVHPLRELEVRSRTMNLEFLGDSVLSIIIARSSTSREYPDVAESDPSRMRAATVSQQPLAAAAHHIGEAAPCSGKGESMHGGREGLDLSAG